MNEPVVLVVEDDLFMQELCQLTLEDFPIILLQAYTVEEAEKLFSENPNIAVISMDACVPGKEPNTPPLVEKFRHSFSGPMIACSRDSTFRKKLLEAGCDCEVEDKKSVGFEILRILGLRK